LCKLGPKHQIAPNGQIALDMFQANPTKFELILMDLTMPIMDGITSCERILAFCSETGTPRPWIVSMSASTSSEIVEQCLAVGMKDFLNKPTRLDGFQAMLLRYLSNKKSSIDSEFRITV
jgi:CheY-like chemotaxis protein